MGTHPPLFETLVTVTSTGSRSDVELAIGTLACLCEDDENAGAVGEVEGLWGALEGVCAGGVGSGAARDGVACVVYCLTQDSDTHVRAWGVGVG